MLTPVGRRRPCFFCTVCTSFRCPHELQSAGVECDGQRPCSRCKEIGKTRACTIGGELDAQVFAGVSDNLAHNGNGPQVSDRTAKKRKANLQSTSPAAVVQPALPQLPFAGIQQPFPQPQPTLVTPVPPSVPDLSSRVPPVRFPATSTSYAPPDAFQDQMKINAYLIEEIKKLKIKHEEIDQQMKSVQNTNEKLVQQISAYQDVLKSLAPPIPPLQITGRSNSSHSASSSATPTSPHSPDQEISSNSSSATFSHTNNNQLARLQVQGPALPPDSEEAMAVFDLIKNPAVVLTANRKFCEIFGYSSEEIIGAPWNQFIHPQHLERTMERLQQEKLSSKLQFIQVYITKTGQPFIAQDTHTFFFGANNVALADFVTIHVLPIPPIGSSSAASLKNAQQLNSLPSISSPTSTSPVNSPVPSTVSPHSSTPESFDKKKSRRRKETEKHPNNVRQAPSPASILSSAYPSKYGTLPPSPLENSGKIPSIPFIPPSPSPFPPPSSSSSSSDSTPPPSSPFSRPSPQIPSFNPQLFYNMQNGVGNSTSGSNFATNFALNNNFIAPQNSSQNFSQNFSQSNSQPNFSQYSFQNSSGNSPSPSSFGFPSDHNDMLDIVDVSENPLTFGNSGHNANPFHESGNNFSDGIGSLDSMNMDPDLLSLDPAHWT